MATCSADVEVTNPISITGTGTISDILTGKSVQQLQTMIDRCWEPFPKQAKQLLVESAQPVDLHALAKFWYLPMMRAYTLGTVAASLTRASWILALGYLKLGKAKEARALTLNGAFIRQCFDIPIERLFIWCGEISDDVLGGRLYSHSTRDSTRRTYECAWQSKLSSDLPIYSQALHSLRTPQAMETYCLKQHALEQLPIKSHHMMGSHVKDHLKKNACHMMQYVDQIGDSWGGDSSTRRHQTQPPKTPSTETQIGLVLVCDANTNERHHLSVGSSTTLKTLFNDYAKERGDSLRSLRFSYSGSTLFLSSAGKKTPDQLNMQDQDIITVYGTSAPGESGGSSNSSNQKNTLALKRAKSTQNQTKKTNGKGKKKKKSKQEAPVKTLQEWKAQHSNKLSKLHEEVHHRLKEIRTRLNALDLKCQRPKQKRKTNGKIRAKHHVDNNQLLPQSEIGGKAGKLFFSVQVGEMQHLYKTTNKPPQKNPRHNATALLDLHGCTREEALLKLDGSLPVWVETAMQGSYPFVTPVNIVCGGGNQILSGTVEKWIREHAQVANAIKNLPQ